MGHATIKPDAMGDDQKKFEHMAVRAQAMIVPGLSKQVTSLLPRCDGTKAVWDRLVEELSQICGKHIASKREWLHERTPPCYERNL